MKTVEGSKEYFCVGAFGNDGRLWGSSTRVHVAVMNNWGYPGVGFFS